MPKGQPFRLVVAGYDGSPQGRDALALAALLATSSARTYWSSARPSGAPARPCSWAAPASDCCTGRPAPERLRAAASVEAGNPATVLRDEAEKGLDLLVLGSRGFGPLRRTFSGSVAAALMQGLACPLLVFPRGAEAPQLERLQVEESAPD